MAFMTRRRCIVVVALLAVALVPAASCAYRPSGWRMLLALLADWLFISLLIWWTCRIGSPRHVPRAFLVLAGLLALPLSCGAGRVARDLDFELRRMQKYESFLATVPRSARCGGPNGARDTFQADVPPQLSAEAIAVSAWWQPDCTLRAEIIWSSAGYAGHTGYYYCTGEDCTRTGHRWGRYVRLNERWLAVAD